MKVNVDWKPSMRFEGVNPEGVTLTMDASPKHGGSGAGPSPMETVLMAAAGCSGMDVISILNKMRAPIEKLRIEVDADRAADHPKVFTAVRMRYIASGPGLAEEQVRKAVSLSQEKYCSVVAMLGKAAELSYEVVVEG